MVKELKRQQSEIESLKRENDQLAARLSIQRTSPAHFAGTSSQMGGQAPSKKVAMVKAKELEKRLTYAQKMDDVVQEEADKVAELDQKIGDLTARTKTARENLGGVTITKDANSQLDNQIKVLENRLDKSLLKFNKALDENKKLRKEIDDLSRERLAFDAIYKELEKELQVKKKKMACIIELSNIAYEERDNAANELAQLKVYAAREMQSFDETFKELDDLLEEDRKMKEGIKAKIAESAARAQAAKTLDRTLKEQEELAKSRTKGQGKSIGARPGDSGNQPMTLQQYEEAFQKIRLATQVSDVNQLVQKFLHAEDDNFSLFNYVNELNNEIEKLEEQRNAVREEVERAKNQDGSGGADAASRRKILKSLEDRLLIEEENAKSFRQKTEHATRILEDAMACIQTIFQAVGCDESVIIEQHGTGGLTETSVLLYLAAIEGQTENLIHQWRQLHSPEGSSVPAGPIKGPALPRGTTNINIEIPSTGEDMSGDAFAEEEDKVLSRDELLTRTQAKLAKTGAGVSNKGHRKMKVKR
eukprot:NODE_913_length_1694_cov_121.441337_g746_i0.p1 GENE.NODE_913_length_1694_cov_121.441337_g746_i0~~NODE_913_length_1694_cov_121.441337_g746_i0.p1  ORF type:complete len:557 (-),score=304.44 NODE_913_length_1694_cov_121.441337_g746_i0:24-1619(-)